MAARLFRLAVSFYSLALVGTTSAKAQTQNYMDETGSPTFTTAQPVEFGFLNLGNGNLHLEFNFSSFPQRGPSVFSGGMVYDSRIWRVVSPVWTPSNVRDTQSNNSWGGWRYAASVDGGTVLPAVISTAYCSMNNQQVASYLIKQWVYLDRGERY